MKKLLNLEYDGILSLGRGGFRNTHKQLCVSCATRMLNWIDNQEKTYDTKEI